MYRLVPRALAPAVLAALALFLTCSSALAAPVVDQEVDVTAVPPVPAPVEVEADLTVDPPAGTSLCADVSVAGNGTGGCAPGGGLPVPLPGAPTDGVAPALAIVGTCASAPAVCAAPLAGAVGGLSNGGLPIPGLPIPGGGLPIPGLPLPGGGLPIPGLPLVGGTSVDACVSLAVAGVAPSCEPDGAVGDGSGGSGGDGRPTLAFTGSATRVLGTLGMGLLALGTVARRLARVRV